MRSSSRGISSGPLWACLAAVCAMSVGSIAAAVPAPVDSLTAEPRQPRDRRPAMITEDDIELIKVYEVDLDAKPRIDIDKDVLRDFLEEFKEDDRIPRGKKAQDDWVNKAEGYEQLDLMFQLRAREYYKEVRVKGTVDSLRAWRRIHSSHVLGYFQQHFGDGAVRGLYLFEKGRETGQIEMTNFYILTQVKIDGQPLIDRNNPEESLLLQWALPREDAKFAAPDVDGWRPRFRNSDDKRFKELVDWIKSLIRANQGSTYGIEYRIPGQQRERPAPAE